MGYRQHWVEAQFVSVQYGTSGEIHDALGGVDEGTGEAVHLVLNDAGNQEAFVLTGTPEDLVNLAERILTRVSEIEHPDKDLTSVKLLDADLRVWEPNPDEGDLGRMYVLDALGVSIVVRERQDGTYVHVEDEVVVRSPLLVEVNNGGESAYGEITAPTETLYRKCAHCHLFVEEQTPEDVAQGFARYIHSHRGNEADEALDESHAAEPESGPGAPLAWWKTFGPPAMRSRFIDDETVDVLGDPLPRGRCDTCGAACDAITGKCMREPEAHQVALPPPAAPFE